MHVQNMPEIMYLYILAFSEANASSMAIVWPSPSSSPSPICHHFSPFVLPHQLFYHIHSQYDHDKALMWKIQSMATMLPSLLSSTLTLFGLPLCALMR